MLVSQRDSLPRGAARRGRRARRQGRLQRRQLRRLLGHARRPAGELLPRHGRRSRGLRGHHRRGHRRRRPPAPPAAGPSSRRPPCSAASARPASSSPPRPCSTRTPAPASTRSATGWRATSAAAPATTRSSAPCRRPPPAPPRLPPATQQRRATDSRSIRTEGTSWSPTEKPAYKVVGTRPIRHDGVDKVIGRAEYGADVRLPGMLQGAVLRSPHAHARILGIDTSRAEAHPGVARRRHQRRHPVRRE